MDPVETMIEDSDEVTTHIKTDTKRLNKKNKYQKQPNRKWNDKSYQKKNETQAIKRRHKINLTKEKEENQKPTRSPSIETKNKFKNLEQMEIEMDLTTTIKKLGQKAQALIGQAGRIWTSKWTLKDQEAHSNCPQSNLMQYPSVSKTVTYVNE